MGDAMIIRCWGSRGSVPVSGKEYLKYGGDTTCIEIRTKDDDIIIVDAGSGIRRLGNSLISEGRFQYNMIFTHAHWDHLMGFPFFKPLYNSKTRLVMLGPPFAQASVKEMVSRVMTSPNFPVDYDDLRADITYHAACESTFSVGSMKVIPISLSHPNWGNGYKFTEEGKSLVFLTDNELMFTHPGGLKYEDYVKITREANLLIHDAEYTEEEYTHTKGWGHSRYTDALRLALDAGVEQFGLFHHNQDRTDDDIDRIVGKCKDIIAKQHSSLRCFAVSQDMETQL
jgi:phosphoribosyl 1,2-cyclic phosphodiesterase